MNQAEFSQALLQEVKNSIAQTQQEIRVTKQTVTKVNEGRREALVCSGAGSRMSAIIYTGPYYEEYHTGTPLGQIAAKVLQAYEANREADFDIPEVQSFAAIRDRIRCEVVNTGKNIELLRKVPHQKVEDLSVIYSIELWQRGEETARIVINRNLLSDWGVDLNDLHEAAIANEGKYNPPVFYLLDDVLNPASGEAGKAINLLEQQEYAKNIDVVSVFVLSNQTNLHGATVMLQPELLKRIRDIIQDDFYILPSSIHEVLVVPKMGEGKEWAKELGEIVRKVNSTQMAPKEVLSNHVYTYDRTRDTIARVNESVVKERGKAR